MIRGLMYAVSACLVWGLIFVIPMILSDFSPLEVIFGRYFTFGLLSICLFLKYRSTWPPLTSKKPLIMALLFSLIANPVYYIGAITGIRLASAPLTVLILGLAPIVIVLYGKQNESQSLPLKSLFFPMTLIVLGLFMVNGSEIDWSFQEKALSDYVIGFIGIMIALLAWSFYVVKNAEFLKTTSLTSSYWATLLGLSTLMWMGVLALFCEGLSLFSVKALFTLDFDHMRFWGGCAILGFICSWVGCMLWNRASVLLPVSLMGPLMIFESLFGLVFVYILEQQIPPAPQLAGSFLMLMGVFSSIFIYQKKTSIT